MHMKCLSCAGGRQETSVAAVQEKLSQAVYQYQKDHSIFQETIARNIPFCDEFIIVTNKEYQFIVEKPDERPSRASPPAGAGGRWGVKTTAAIVLLLSAVPFFSELMFVGGK